MSKVDNCPVFVLLVIFFMVNVNVGRAQSPSDVPTLKNLLAELKKNDLVGAEAFCSEKMKNAPPSLKAYLQLNRGTIRIRLNKLPYARQDMEKALLWATEHPEDTLHPYALTALGIWFQASGNTDSAEIYYQKGLETISGNIYWTLKADCLELLGLLNISKKQYVKAYKILNEAYNLSSRKKNDRYQARMALALGDIEQEIWSNERAFEFYLNAEAAAIRAEERALLSIAQLNLGKTSYQISLEETAKSEYWLQQSLRYYRQASENEKKVGGEYLTGILATETALTLLKLKDAEGALALLEPYNEQIESEVYKPFKSRYWYVLTLIYQAQKQIQKADEAAYKFLSLENADYSREKSEILSILAENALTRGDYLGANRYGQQAQKASQAFNAKQDSLLKSMPREDAANLKSSVSIDVQEERILYEQKRSRILLVSLLITVALFFGGVALYLNLLKSREKLRRYNAVIEKQNTALADQKREIEQLVQSKNQLFSHISYNIRLPLTLAKVPAELLEADYRQELSEGGQYLLQGLIRNLVRLQEFSEEIALLSEPEPQTGSLQLQTLYLPDFAADIRNSFELTAQTKQITFTYKLFLAPGAEYIVIDRNKLEKIILTLVLNAFKITPQGGNISMELQTSFQADSSVQLELAVCDNGPEIPEDYLSDISKWYLRGQTDENSVTTILTISNELARRMDARMQATNLPGTGARIALLTRCRPGLAVPTVSSTQPASDFSPSTAQPSSDALPVVHLVEDNDDTRDLLAFAFQNQFQIVEHTTGASFLQYLYQEQPAVKVDLLLVDIMLQDISGIELIRKIRRAPRFRLLPIIAITGNNLASFRNQIFEEGADELFIKPFNLGELSIRIRSLLARISSLKEQQPADTAAEPRASKAEESIIDRMLDTVPASQKSWVLELIGIIEEQVSNQELDIATLAREMAVSERQLYRFVKSRTGFSPNQLIHEVRLHSALQLLNSDPNLPIAQVSLMVGFENPGYFSVVFKKRFGKNPSDFKNIETS